MQRRYTIVTAIHDYKFEVRASNAHKTFLGNIIMDIGGNFYLYDCVDAIPSYVLREIADLIEELERQFEIRLDEEIALREAIQSIESISLDCTD